MNLTKMSLSISVLALSFAACSTVYASTLVVAPNANAAVNGGNDQLGFLGESSASTFQIDIAASQLTSLVGQSITALGLRLGSGQASVAGPVTISGFSLELSGSANPIGSLSATQSANIGAGAQVVDSGPLTLSGLVGGTGPNPFFLIDFSTPYLYTGGNLLITDSYTVGNSALFLDGVTEGAVVDSSANLNGTAQAQFYNVPVVELVAAGPTITAVPEPGSLALLGTGVVSLACMLRRRFV